MRQHGRRAALLALAPLMVLALLIGSCSDDDNNPIVPTDTTAPAAALLATGTITTTSVQLTWTARGDDGTSGTASQYDVRYSTSAITNANFASATAVTGAPAPAAAGTSQSVTVNGLTPNTLYFFAMKIADEVPNWSVLSNVALATTGAVSADTTPPAVATLAVGTVTTTSVQLSWTAPGDDGTTGTANRYDIRYSTSAITPANFAAATAVTGAPAPAAAGTAQSVTVSGLTPNTPYYFAMMSGDEVPNWSNLSNVAQARTDAGTPGDSTPPAAATLATGTVTPTSVQLTWTAPGDDGTTGMASQYDIRYSTAIITDGNFAAATAVTGVPIPSAAGTSQSVTVSGLAPNTPYYFAMKSADEVPNWSAISNVPSATTTSAADVTAPAGIISLVSGTLTNVSVQLMWTSPGDDGNAGTASQYDIRYSTAIITDGNFAVATAVTGVPIPSAAGTSQSVTVSGLVPNTPYHFAMKTADEVPNWSVISNTISATTLSAGPDLPGVPVPPLEHTVDLCSTDPVALEIQDEIQGQIESARNMAETGRSYLEDLYSADWTQGSGDCYTSESVAPACTSSYRACRVGDGFDFSLTVNGTCWLGQPVENWMIWSGHVSSDGLSGTTTMRLNPSMPDSFMTTTWLVAADGKSGEYKWYNGPVDPSRLFISMNFEERADGTFEAHWVVSGLIKWDLEVSADGKSGTYDWYMVDFLGGGGWNLFQHTEWADCHGSRTTYIMDPPQVETW